jgi:hypothetical protein
MTSTLERSQPIVQLTLRGVIVHADAEHLDVLRAEFARQHFFRLPQLLEPELLDRILKALDSAPYSERRRNGELREDRLPRSSVANMTLHFVANCPTFIELISDITQLPISSFRGRVFRRLAELGHYSGWHDDTFVPGRLAGMSLNLGEGYRGGDLELRHVGESSGEVIENRVLGDSVVFRIAPNLEHRVRPVDGTVFRRALAGWFYATDRFDALLRSVVRNQLVPSRFGAGTDDVVEATADADELTQV